VNGEATRPARDALPSERQGGLRERLLRAALLMVQTEGIAAISVREVARRAGVSSGAPFRHFKDRNALLAAIAEDGLLQLEAETARAVLAAGDDIVEQLKAMGVAFATFAATHPAHFRVMHDPSLGLDGSPQLEAIRERQKCTLRELIVRGQALGLGRPGDPDMLALLCVCVVGGLARLLVEGGPECPIAMPMRNLDAVERTARAVVELAGLGLLSDAERPRYEARARRAARAETPKKAPKKATGAKKKKPARRPIKPAPPESPRARPRGRQGPAR
jgi:AcrR family transcriptional regulator